MYRTGGQVRAVLVGRLVSRAKLVGSLPCEVEIVGADLRYGARFAESERIVVLVVAAEEDSGHGVRRIYASLEAPEHLAVYDVHDVEPIPRALDEYAGLACAPPQALRIEVLLGGTETKMLSNQPEYVSACAFSLSVKERDEQLWRLPFVDAAGRNEWTLSVRVRVN
jgi:hypothetical protein